MKQIIKSHHDVITVPEAESFYERLFQNRVSDRKNYAYKF